MQKYFRIFYVIFLAQFLNTGTIFSQDQHGVQTKETKLANTTHHNFKKEKEKKIRNPRS